MLLVLLQSTFLFGFSAATLVASSCRYLPGDAGWPLKSAWDALNKTVGGRLIATIPLASPCHGSNYNETACAALKEGWPFAQTHFPSSSSTMQPLFLNQTCDPFSAISAPCQLGNLAHYSINVSSAADIAAGIAFAEHNNIRVVIKNTGHDYQGMSTGKGALGLWVHNLNDINFLNYSSKAYSGPAARVGTGVLGFQALEAARKAGFRIVTGSCPTVAVAGGYTQGAGHSLLSSTYGLSADNVLEWEVVTTDGRHLTATPTSNADLYWALSGGGGGTYAVVLSMTVRVFKDGIVSAVGFQYTSDGITNEDFWSSIRAFHEEIPALADAGFVPAYTVLDTGPDSHLVYIQPITFPDTTASKAREHVANFVARLDALNITYIMNVTSFSNYYDHFNHWQGPLPYGVSPASQLQTARLIPRSLITTNQTGALVDLIRNITGRGLVITSVGLNVARAPLAPNSVNPAWRRAIIELIVHSTWNFSQPWSANAELNAMIADEVDPALVSLTPGSGTYGNEGNPDTKGWQEQFYGVNYEGLVAIKKKWDPKHLFWGNRAVGSEAWTVAQDGRLCRLGYDHRH